MLQLLHAKRDKGVDIKVIGSVASGSNLPSRVLSGLRLHTRTIIRDRKEAFVGSQSLRELELDGRREAGIITGEPDVVSQIVKTFEEDWQGAQEAVPGPENEEVEQSIQAAKVAKKVAKAVTNGIVPIAPLVEQTIKEVSGDQTELTVDAAEMELNVRTAVKAAVKKVVREAVEAGTGVNE
jgi:PLD-like domain